MATEKAAKPDKNDKKKNAGKKKLPIAANAIIDNMVFSKDERWAYYKLSNSVFDFLSLDAKLSVGQQLINAFVNLMSDRQEPLDCHLIITSSPVNIDAWEDQIRTVSEDWTRGPGFDQYIHEQAEHLKDEEYLRKETFLGVCLGKRGALEIDTSNMFEGGLKGASEIIRGWMSTALKLPSEEISIDEEKTARNKEEEFYRILSMGNLRAERCTAEELLLLIKRQFYPAMPAPYLDVDYENRIGPGDLELELTSAIENKLRWLKINQMIGEHEVEGVRACLTIAKLPRNTNFPYSSFPFMYFLHKLGLPFTSFARFQLHPTSKMKKELEKKKKEQKDELENIAGGGDSTVDGALGMMPSDVQESLEDMRMLNEMLAQGKTPWVEGTYRIVVETVDEKALKNFCSIVKQRYTDLDINITWTVGDQAQLFLEQMPGDKLRTTSHKQLTNLVMFGTSGFNYSSDVGDKIFDGRE